jgi:hypothetical protein
MNTKTTPSSRFSLFTAATLLLFSPAPLRAGSFSSDFNSGLPAGTSTYGDGAVLGSGGYGGSGFVQLTPDVGSKAGSFVITNDLDEGVPVVSFTASFKVLIGGGDRFGYGDGMSFNFGPDVPLAADSLAEQGVGSGLRVGMRASKDSTSPNPAISVSGAGTPVSGSPAYADNLRANTFVDMVVQLNPDNTLSILYDGVYLYSNVPLGYTPGAGSLFWIGGRTGGSREKHFIDNLNIVTRTNPAPFISSFAPRGRQVSANGAIDIVLTDYSTQVNTNTIVLSLDSVTVSPTITQDGAGHTTVHFVPASPFAASSEHSASLTFADNAAQTQSFAWQFTVTEAQATSFMTVFSDDFESYALGYADKQYNFDPNYAPNGSGNPWFGPYPENFSFVDSYNLTVAGTNVSVTPHSGNRMMTTAWPGVYNVTIWADLAYRAHGGVPIQGNCRLDWWFFDANDRTNRFFDYVSLYFYNSGAYAPPATVPYTADWKAGWDETLGMFWENGFAWGDNDFQSLSLGGSGYNQNGGYYKPGTYQVRLEEMATGVTYGIDGWIDTIERTQGWHHNRIVIGSPHPDGTALVSFYIDDMANPVYSGLSSIAGHGITLLEIDNALNATPSFYDDITFSLAVPPPITATRSGNNLVLTWSGGGFTLQKADTVNGPWSDVNGADSGYSYDITAGPRQFFRLKN